MVENYGDFLGLRLKSMGKIERKIIKRTIGKTYFSIPGIDEPKKKPRRDKPIAQRMAPMTL